MSIYGDNYYLAEGNFWSRFKKKLKENQIGKKVEPKYTLSYDELVKQIKPIITKVINDIQKNDNFKKKFRKEVNSLIAEVDGFEYYQDKLPKLSVSEIENNLTGVMIIINDDEQEIRTCIPYEMIISELNKDSTIKKLKRDNVLSDISFGDGDEGCIYFDTNYKL